MSLVFALATLAASGVALSDRSIENFNRRFQQLIAASNHAGMLALWAEDGVDLMPGEAPLLGKAAIRQWPHGIESGSPRSSVASEKLEFHDIVISGDWAFEWATEEQVIQSEGKSPVEGHGKLVLILHRDASGSWKIKQEMWNDSPH